MPRRCRLSVLKLLLSVAPHGFTRSFAEIVFTCSPTRYNYYHHHYHFFVMTGHPLLLDGYVEPVEGEHYSGAITGQTTRAGQTGKLKK